jgi:uracil permease
MDISAQEGITDARELGMPKYIILGVQHLFAMFGATDLVPVLTGLSVSSTLLFAGIGTLVFHFVSKSPLLWSGSLCAGGCNPQCDSAK